MTRRRLPRGTTAAMAGTVLLEGEVAYDTIQDRLKVGDGVAPGGVALARKSEVDAAAAKADAAAPQTALNALAQTVGTKADAATVTDLAGRVAAQEALGAVGVVFGEPVRVRSTANVAIATGLENGDTLNGVTLATGDRVLLAHQTAPAENGVYVVAASGAATRAADADSAAELARRGVYVREGDAGAGEQWTLPLAAADITVGTTALTWVLLRAGEASVATELAALTEQVGAQTLGSGNLISFVQKVRGLAGGAVAVTGNDWALTVPAGSDGNFSNLAARRRVDGAAMEGRTVKYTFVSETAVSDPEEVFTRDVYPRIIVYSASAPLGEFRTGVYTPVSPPDTVGQRVDTIEYTFQGDETQLEPMLLVNDATTAASDETLTPVFLGEEFTDAPDLKPGETLGDLKIEDRLGRFAGRIGALGGYGKYARIVTVKPSGGDFTSIKAANDAIVGASATQRVKIEVYPGVAAPTAEVVTKDWVDYIGVGRREDIVQHLALADDTASETIEATSTFWLTSNSEIANMTVAITNGRYALHWETSAARPFNRSAVRNCIFIHHGNDNASNNPLTVNRQNAVGAGQSDGEEMLIEGCVCIGPGGGFSYHTPNITSRTRNATLVEARYNSFIATHADGHGLKIVPITVGGGDRCVLVGNQIVGGILYETSQWVSTDTAEVRAQVEVIGHGNKGAVFVSIVDGPAAGALYRPFLADEETRGLNGTGSAIAKGTVLAWADDARLKVRPMTSADAAAMFAGVAWEAIADGALGRVKCAGWLALSPDVLRTGAEALAINDNFSIDPSNPGHAVKGGAQGLLTVVQVASGYTAVKVA